jgi:hemerythrin
MVQTARYFDEDVMMIFMEHRRDIHIIEEVVRAAAGNEKYGNRVIELLLQHTRDHFQMTEEVMKAAAGNWGAGGMSWHFCLNEAKMKPRSQRR